MIKLPLYLSSVSDKFKFIFTIAMLVSSLSTISVTAQNNPPLIGHWQLQKVSFKKMVADNSEIDKDLFFGIFKAVLYEELPQEQRLNPTELEGMNAEAEILRDTYYQTTIEFQSNGAFYNTSLNKDKSLSGEYLLDKKKLNMQWETGDETYFKVLKYTASELVLKDTKTKITFYYLKNKPSKS